MKMRMCVVVIGLLLGLGLPEAMSGQTSGRCFRETNLCIEGRILEFWEQNGGLRIFGLPISSQHEEQIEGQPLQVQWFERSRIELHPENPPPFDVQLGRVGADRLIQQGRDWFQFPRTEQQPGCIYFEITGHNICGEFLATWRADGVELDQRLGSSLPENVTLFGLPLSDEQTETIDGQPITVQWFERARFEWHPNNQSPSNVYFGLLGREIQPQQLPDPKLPEIDERAISAIAQRPDLKPQPLARQNTVIYALPGPDGTLPGPGAALLLTAIESAADIPESVLLDDPKQLNGVMLGGLRVVLPIIPKLAPGPYVFTPSSSGDTVRLVGERDELTIELPMVIRSLPLPARRPFAMITANQLCLGLSKVVVCAVVPIPLPDSVVGRLEKAAANLKISQDAFLLRQALPDIEGLTPLATCEQALAKDQPAYQDCQPSLLVAPAAVTGSIPPPPEPGFDITSIALMAILTTVDGPVYLDATLQAQADKLSEGDYTMFEVRRPEDLVIRGNVQRTRIRLLGAPPPATQPSFYLPALSGIDPFGVVERGQDPKDQAAILNLGVGSLCTDFFSQECDALQ
jgi:hypothetical protein